MERTTKIRGPIAWLALVALGLSLVGPVVSRLLLAPMPMGPTPMVGEHGHTQPSSPGVPHQHPLDECGYCTLLASHPFAPPMPPRLPSPPPTGIWAAPPVTACRVLSDRPPDTAPRGPPATLLA